MIANELISLLASDLSQYLEEHAPGVEGPIYAMSLWVEPVYAQFGVMLATQAAFERRRSLPLYRDLSDEEAYGPAFRWYSGEWDTPLQDFVRPRSEQTLQPLASILDTDQGGDERWLQAVRSWHRIGYGIISSVQLPSSMPTTPDVLVYVEMPDRRLVEAAHVMLRNVPVNRFHAAIPAWRRLAMSVRLAQDDPVAMARIRHQADEWAAGRLRFPYLHEPATDSLTSQLRACGLTWRDVAMWTEDLTETLAIADCNEDWRPTPENLERTGE